MKVNGVHEMCQILNIMSLCRCLTGEYFLLKLLRQHEELNRQNFKSHLDTAPILLISALYNYDGAVKTVMIPYHRFGHGWN